MLLSLPDELLVQILVQLDIPDIVNLSLVCKDVHTLVADNEALWRVFLQKKFDPVCDDSPQSPRQSASSLAAQHLHSVSHEDHLALIYNLHNGIGASNRKYWSSATPLSSVTRPSSSSSSSSSSSLSSSSLIAARKKSSSSLDEMKRRFRLFLRNGPTSRSKYANPQYRLRLRERVVDYALKLLREHENCNFSVLASSQLFSAVIFDQLLPGTIPALQLERLPSAAAYTLKPNAISLQQRVDMLRLIFSQRLACSPLPYDLREMQTISYDSSRFPLFTTVAGASTNRAGALSIASALSPQRLPDSPWADVDVLFDQNVVPRFDVLLAIINFFVYNSDRNAMLREGFLPFFNTPPDAVDFNFKGGETFDFPRDWTGIYGYLAFWDFDLLRQASAGAAATASATSHTSAVADNRFTAATVAPPLPSDEPESSQGTTPGLHLPNTPYIHPSIPAIASSSDSSSSGSAPSLETETERPNSTLDSAGNNATGAPPPGAREPGTVKLQDQFDGFQVLEIDAPSMHGPASFMGRGHDRFDYVAYATLAPFDQCYGLPGFARFSMRKEYVRSERPAEEEDEVVWEYNGVYIPGPKIIVGRWRDGTDISQTNAVEGPFMFFADEL
ncbi:hypothetical protein V1525DRAFT_192032 [Lipomyces kononenkoae]|uniref:Uncharacterized protein n=1 Tax=Lipomyces kononenkoae TaxID=34357 RepID=A0ACC3SYX1_LIPKO